MSSAARQPELNRIPEETMVRVSSPNFSRPQPGLYSHFGVPSRSRPGSPVERDARSIAGALQKQLRLHPEPPSAKVAPKPGAYRAWDDDSDDAAPPPVVRTHAAADEFERRPRQLRGPQVLSYKAYANDAADSDTSSILTDASDASDETETTTDDCESFAETVDTGQSSVDDYYFDGQHGWRPYPKPSQANRGQQRWAPPVVQPQPPRQQDSQRTRSPSRTRSRSAHRQQVRATWLSDHSEDSDPLPSSGFANDPSQAAVKDVFETAADQLESLERQSRTRMVPSRKQSEYSIDSSNTFRLGEQVRSRPPQPDIRSKHRPLIPEHIPSHHYNTAGAPATPAPLPMVPNGNTALDRSDSSATATGSLSSLSSNEVQASGVDISQLSPAKLKKLEAKGINAQLYLEMKAARRGRGGKRRLGGVLTANSFLS